MLLAAVVVAQYLAGYLFLVWVRLDPRKRRRSPWRATPITTAIAPTCAGRCVVLGAGAALIASVALAVVLRRRTRASRRCAVCHAS